MHRRLRRRLLRRVHRTLRNHPSRGAAAIFLILASVSVLLFAASVTINAGIGFSAHSQNQADAVMIARFAGAELPNIKAAFKVGCEAFIKLTGRDLTKPNAAALPGNPNRTLDVFVTSAAGEMVPVTYSPPSTPPPNWGTATILGNALIDVCKGASLNELIDGTHVALPIKSMTFRISEVVPLRFINLTNTSSFTVRNQVTVQIEPADVVIVIENSNSMFSKLEDGDKKVPAAFNLGPSTFTASNNPDEDWRIQQAHSLEECWEMDHELEFMGSGNAADKINDGSLPTTWPYCISKAERFTRQCFGEVTKNMKRAAVRLYDILSSSGTFRVGVVHNMGAIGEQALVSVPLTTHPYERRCTVDKFKHSVNREYYNPIRRDLTSLATYGYLCGKNDDYWGIDVDPNGGAVDPSDPNSGHRATLEQSYGLSAYPSTRCAAITSEPEYNVPDHPLAGNMTGGDNPGSYGGYYGSIFTRNLNVIQRANGAGSLQFLDSMPDIDEFEALDHLRFRSNGEPMGGRFDSDGALGTSSTGTDVPPITLHPREVIWMKPSGVLFDNGVPIPKYYYNDMRFGILRAADMLKNAPARKDGQIVRKKFIIVLTDGVDDICDPALSHFLTVNAPYVSLSDDTHGNIKVIDSKSLAASFPVANSPTYCLNTPGAPSALQIETHSRVPPLNDRASFMTGIHLGIMYYGYGGPKNGSDGYLFDEDPYQANLFFHGAAANVGGRLSKFRTECTSKWFSRRGRFWAEAKTKDDYWQRLPAEIARAAFVPDIVEH